MNLNFDTEQIMGNLLDKASSASSSSSSASGSFTPGGNFDSISDFPEWLGKPNIDELENEYKGVDSFFNIDPKVKPMRKLANAQYSNALQQGANAADEAVSRAFQTGIVGPINTSMISAQTAMPALLAKLGSEKDIAGIRINNMYKQQEARASLAAQIASMRKSYVDTMANYALGEDRLGADFQLGSERNDLARDQFEFGTKQYEDKKGSGTSWEDLATTMASWNKALGSGGAQINWTNFLSGLTPSAKSSPANMSMLGLA